jgi:hypothetical protein
MRQPCDMIARPHAKENNMHRDTDLLNAVQSYFDALYACDLSLFDQIFHPACSLFDADEGAITVDPIADYRQACIASKLLAGPRRRNHPDRLAFASRCHCEGQAADSRERLRRPYLLRERH